MRPYWKGYLKLALVSCPIALHAACSSAERIAFRQVNKATGNRLRQQLIDEETREPVAPEHKGRGYEVANARATSARCCSAARRLFFNGDAMTSEEAPKRGTASAGSVSCASSKRSHPNG